MGRPAPAVSASILGADFARLGEDVRDALAQGAQELHLDVMDGHFVPNLTMGPDVTRAMRRVAPEAPLDVHLMIENPGAFIEPFAEAGADVIAFHAEGCAPLHENGADAQALIRRIRDAGARPAMALNPPTEPRHVAPFLDTLDRVLVMSVHPGYAGQRFMAEALPKLEALAGRGPALAVDGGVGPETGPQCTQAGADVLIAASALFRAEDRAEAVKAMRKR